MEKRIELPVDAARTRERPVEARLLALWNARSLAEWALAFNHEGLRLRGAMSPEAA